MTKYIPLILFTVLTNFCSQITLKHGMTSMSKIELTPSTLLPTLFSVVFNPPFSRTVVRPYHHVGVFHAG